MSGDQLSALDRRRELLRRRLAESGVAAQAVDSVPRVQAGERRELAPGQRRMWFMQTKDPADTSLNICVAHRMRGALDQTRLRDAVAAVIRRHDVLRTVYGVDSAGEPYQLFIEEFEVPWTAVDLTDLTGDAQDRQVRALADSEFGRPFDLAADRPLRVTLLRLGAEDFVVLLVVHHICWDDNSWEVFFAELSEYYHGRPIQGDAPQFMVVSAATEPSSEADLGYWRQALTPLPDPLELPGAASTYSSRAARRLAVPMPAETAARIEEFAREHSATPFMVLLAAFGVLVHRYTGSRDFVTAIPVAERKSNAEKAIGYFGNTLLLRTAVNPDASFASHVAAVREVCLDAFGHQNVGIDEVVREVNPSRSTGHDGMDELVRLGFSMRKDASGYRLEGVDVTQLDLAAVSAQLPLSLAIATESSGTIIEFEYQTDVLPQWLVGQLLVHYQRLLADGLSRPEETLARVELFDAEEHSALLDQSHGVLTRPSAATLVDLLDAAARATPEALAVVSDDLELTYELLQQRSNRFARWLVAQGAGTEDVIALQMSTSVEFIVAMLGVLKSGAAYMPIDPALPEERIEYLIADAKPRIVMRPQEFQVAEAAAAGLADAPITDADRLRPLLPDNLAYVIYTSGSTGRPKGVAVAHAAIAEHVVSFTAEWSMTADDRMLQSTSVSFDASLADILCPLSLGAQLVIPKPNPFSDIGYVADLVRRRGVTVLHMVPSLLGSVLLLPEARELRGLRHVPVGGEALPGEVADKFATMFDAELRNHYGPTEAVVCSTYMSVRGPQGNSIVPIGRPNQNVYAYVLDQALELVPAGVVGELYLGGAQLARGYRARPVLTAERFVADPFGSGGRLYRTGDLVRRNARGELEFVGRADEQVKVRGYRIELGEIEAVIGADPRVGHCVATVVDDPQVGPLLAAYVVPAGGTREIDLDELRARAQEALPAYMVPTAFAVIPEIPLTTSGKLDKRALPTPDALTERAFRLPVTPTERRMCAIYSHLFGKEAVGLDDSFFELGGHSLLAARLVAQIRAQFGIDLTVRAVFDRPTPAGLAEQLVTYFREEFEIELDELDLDESDEMEAAPQDGRPDLVAAERPERLPLSSSQLSMWFECQMEGVTDIGNMWLALRFDGPLQTPALIAALNDVVARHEALRTNIAIHEGAPYQIVHPSRELAVPILRSSPEGLSDTLAELRHHIFGLETESLIRPAIIELSAQEHVLALVVHHIVVDHASFTVIVDDLIAAYRARLEGQAPQWDPQPVQYADYVLWQRDAFAPDSEFGQAEVNFWRQQLAGVPTEIAVAHDRARPQILGKRGEVAKFVMEPERRQALTRMAEQRGVTEFMVYQAALAVVLHRLGGGTDIVIGSPVAARVHPHVAKLVGLFANMVALRNDVSGDPSLRSVLERSRDATLNAHAHQELPIEKLVEAVNPVRSLSWNPLFQTMVNFRGADWGTAARDVTVSGETTVVPLPMEVDVSYLDLNFALNVTPSGGLDVSVVANADLYDHETTRMIAQALDTAFDAFVNNQESRVSEIVLLPADAMAQLMAPPAAAVEPVATPSVEGSEETKLVLISILEELLEISDVDPEDNFFALGGDSVISIQWSTRAAERGLAMTPQMVFECATIAQLAGAVDAAGQVVTEGDSHLVTPSVQSAPMSASGLSADALAELTASWQAQS
ncbi:putative non-ribosomal peptide synthetase MbtE [Mycobacteroides abscessus subsp. massiliense]|uniref:non-ribosomal peptide synthetase n=1 Tax=Mycobacteroides abscessus TaxID=36809 RepID=UPI0009A75402|nr:non-ribosomal peptide synthetase [Mycobacteroides abscessus]SKF86501.1 putative non-ribosomal peptide synthetase MbtE [Mycobacteroides abscessus subsp. massiliense]SKG38498.1 putative non-ribosomal peptide synthetase MbtE [Mycobacteroides abscessus subsp. massiliense]SKH37387.1 putative non-ribosomal peptide synthetase MbtE [Mycobacteroides abscessus subsp. massiliense]SKI81768.1 putative non-ribosomal peptide synthetase MbtE [Mycobacteroides abscessus subsp. massiliense]SKY39469.1 putative